MNNETRRFTLQHPDLETLCGVVWPCGDYAVQLERGYQPTFYNDEAEMLSDHPGYKVQYLDPKETDEPESTPSGTAGTS